jgi:hypothetical protein
MDPQSCGKIHIWHNNTWFLHFMYAPVIYSLMKVLPLMYNNRTIEFKTTDHNYESLLEGDILIWVGVYELPFSELRINRKIYTIYFNTEPFISELGSDEIWTYSLYMYNLYKSYNKPLKFIPIICDESVPKTNYLKNNNDMRLTFIGSLMFDRREKEEIINSSGVKINEVYNLWNENDYNQVIINNTHIYLNLTKGQTKALPAVRINKLLSHKCIIISEHTNPDDEELYKDLVFFKKLTEIGDFYNSLITMSNFELENIAESSYKKFISKFKIDNAINLIQTSNPATEAPGL